MSGYLDDELTSAETEEMEAHLEGCAECRAEFEEMTLLVSASSGLSVELPSEDVWEDFLPQVYSRMERKAGMYLFALSCIALSVIMLYYMVVLEWASPIVKLATEIGMVGLVILFISALRQRMAIRRTDRYSRDIHH
jgi:anti-sigma factor RsiW